jgi:hypothetical protein
VSKGPAIWVVIDGIDGVGKTTCCGFVSAILDIPTVRSGRNLAGTPWPAEIRACNDALVMTTIHQVKDYLPSVVFDRSQVSVCAYNKEAWDNFDNYPWELYYPKDRTVFITLTDDIERTIKSEGEEVYRPLMIQRIHEQRRFVILAEYLGKMGYRTTVIPASDGPVVTYHRVIDYIRAMQLDILEDYKRKGLEEDE